MVASREFLLIFKCVQKVQVGEEPAGNFADRVWREACAMGLTGMFNSVDRQCIGLLSGDRDTVISLVEILLSRAAIGDIQVIYEGMVEDAEGLPELMDHYRDASEPRLKDALDVGTHHPLSPGRNQASLLH